MGGQQKVGYDRDRIIERGAGVERQMAKVQTYPIRSGKLVPPKVIEQIQSCGVACKITFKPGCREAGGGKNNRDESEA